MPALVLPHLDERQEHPLGATLARGPPQESCTGFDGGPLSFGLPGSATSTAPSVSAETPPGVAEQIGLRHRRPTSADRSASISKSSSPTASSLMSFAAAATEVSATAADTTILHLQARHFAGSVPSRAGGIASRRAPSMRLLLLHPRRFPAARPAPGGPSPAGSSLAGGASPKGEPHRREMGFAGSCAERGVEMLAFGLPPQFEHRGCVDLYCVTASADPAEHEIGQDTLLAARRRPDPACR